MRKQEKKDKRTWINVLTDHSRQTKNPPQTASITEEKEDYNTHKNG